MLSNFHTNVTLASFAGPGAWNDPDMLETGNGMSVTEVSSTGGHDVLAKSLANGDVPVALFDETESTAAISTTAAAVGKSGASSYTLTNLWTGVTSATTGTISTTTSGEIHAVVASNCLDVNNSSTTAGTQLQIWSCNGGANQQWNLNADGTITGVQSGLCLDVTGGSTADGALVELWTCNGQSNQQWILGHGRQVHQ